MNVLTKKTEDEFFTFIPKETTDKQRIEEILDIIYTTDAPSGKLYNGDRLSLLGKEVAKKLAVKATEYPFLRIFHYYKRNSVSRSYGERYFKINSHDYHPSLDADLIRRRYNDPWDDDSFFALFENLNGEVAATCKIVTCPGCKGSGKESYVGETKTSIEMTCPKCQGSGMEGIYICKRCDGHGKVPGIRTTKQKCERSCSECGGEGKVKAILKAYLKTEAGSANSEDSAEYKMTTRTGECEEIKWTRILEHDPQLCDELHNDDFSWSRLKDDNSKKAARIRLVKKIVVKGGVIDPNKNNLSDLPLLRKEDIKRVYDECYPQKEKLSFIGRSVYQSAYFKQHDTSDPNVRTICSDEEIRIVTGVGWIRIVLSTKDYHGHLTDEIWINTLTKEVKEVPMLYWRDGKYADERPDPGLHKAIKEARKKVPKSVFPKVRQAKKSFGVCWRLILALFVGAFFWWWLEGFATTALPEMLEQVKGIRSGISENLRWAMIVSGGTFFALYLLTFVLSKMTIRIGGVAQFLALLIGSVPTAVLIITGHWGVGGLMAIALVGVISTKIEGKVHESWWRWTLMPIGLLVSGGFGMNGNWIISSVITVFSIGILLKDEK